MKRRKCFKRGNDAFDFQQEQAKAGTLFKTASNPAGAQNRKSSLLVLFPQGFRPRNDVQQFRRNVFLTHLLVFQIHPFQIFVNVLFRGLHRHQTRVMLRRQGIRQRRRQLD